MKGNSAVIATPKPNAVANNASAMPPVIAEGAPSSAPPSIPKLPIIPVTVPNKQTIVLGGLITGKKGTSVSGIPILSSIPILGKLFSNTVKADTREELLIFLQPSIITSRSSLDAAQADVNRRYKAGHDTRNFADGPEALPAPNSSKASLDKNSLPKAIPVEPQPAPAKTKKSIQPTRY